MPIEIVARVIAATLARFQHPKYDDYIAVAHELYPTEMCALEGAFTRQGFIKWLKAGMRATTDITEENPDAPFVQLELLPGLPMPAYMNIGTDREPDLIRSQDLDERTFSVAIDKRKKVIGRISARVEDLEMKRIWYIANRRRPSETLGQVIARMDDKRPDFGSGFGGLNPSPA